MQLSSDTGIKCELTSWCACITHRGLQQEQRKVPWCLRVQRGNGEAVGEPSTCSQRRGHHDDDQEQVWCERRPEESCRGDPNRGDEASDGLVRGSVPRGDCGVRNAGRGAPFAHCEACDDAGVHEHGLHDLDKVLVD